MSPICFKSTVSEPCGITGRVGAGELWLLVLYLLWNNVLSTHFQEGVVSPSGIRHLGNLPGRARDPLLLAYERVESHGVV